MKKTVIFLVAALFTMVCQAHVYDPISKEGKMWTRTVGENETAYLIHGDTVINGTAYKCVLERDQNTYGDNEWHYYGGVRDAARRTYIIYAEGSWMRNRFSNLCDASSGEMLLYDFSIGGMRTDAVMGGRSVFGDWAKNIVVGDHERRYIVFWTNQEGPGPWVIDYNECIEGIGMVNDHPFLPYYYQGMNWYSFTDKSFSIDDYNQFTSFLLNEENYISPTGDANGDGLVDVSDVDVVIDAVLGKTIDEEHWDDVSAGIHAKPDVSNVDAIIDAVLGK